MSAGLGNPMIYKLEKPNSETKEEIAAWQKNGLGDEIPVAAHHMVLLNCYACARANKPFNLNLVKAVLLGAGGEELPEYNIAFYPVYKIQDWLREKYLRRQRTKHVMSSLSKETPTQHMSQESLYEYSP